MTPCWVGPQFLIRNSTCITETARMRESSRQLSFRRSPLLAKSSQRTFCLETAISFGSLAPKYQLLMRFPESAIASSSTTRILSAPTRLSLGGGAKSPPPSEMEKMMMANVKGRV